MTTHTQASTSDRIEEQVILPFPRARVWRALTNVKELGTWFGADLSGPAMATGARITGNITSPGYEHLMLDVTIAEMVPEQRFAWRWHPHAIDSTTDYSREPMTLVTFTLEDTVDGGTLLRVVESGFDALQAERRQAAIDGNSNGWRGQLQRRLPAYLATA